MKTSFECSLILPVSAEKVFTAWLDSELHCYMTGGEAHCSDKVGEHFTAWDGYIQGKNLAIETNKMIRQSWRTSNFEEGLEDSIITVKFKDTESGVQITLIHEDIPEGQPDYQQGWEEYYFEPMKVFFGN